MKKKEGMVCPGCKRGCGADNPRCKYGRMYFAGTKEKEKQRKWEKRVEADGLAWRFLTVSRRIKHGLREGRWTEEQAFDTLSASERQTLGEILVKLDRRFFSA